MAEQLEAEWLGWPQTQALIALCAASHIEICFVGGAVRDAIAGREPFDIDCMTTASVAYVMTVVEKAGLYHELRGPKQDVVVTWVDGKRFDIGALGDEFRHESFLTRVKLYLEKDYDFTINALMLTPHGDLYDPFGGVADIEAGRIGFLQEPEIILADPFRILRYFRLAGTFGKGIADAQIVGICARQRESLRQIVGWRRYQETLKIAMAPKGVRMLRVMAREWILPEALDFSVSDLQAFEHLVAIEGMLKLPADPETRMILFSVLASISCRDAISQLAQPYGWFPAMVDYYVWIAEQLRARIMVRQEWRETMGEPGFRRMVLAQWALEEDVMEASPYFSVLL